MSYSEEDLPDLTNTDLLGAYYDAIKQTYDYAQENVVRLISGQLNATDLEIAVQGTFYRAHAVAASLSRLNNVLDATVAASCCRTLYELWLDLRVLTDSKKFPGAVEKYHSFPDVARYRVARRIHDLELKHPELKNAEIAHSHQRKNFVTRPGKKDEIEATVQKVWGLDKNGKLDWPEHWSGLSTYDRARLLGPIYEHEYRELYGMLSWYTHSGSTGIVGISEEGFEGLYGIAFDTSRGKYLESLIVTAKVFHLFDAVKNFGPLLKYLQDAPHHILVEYSLEKMKEHDKVHKQGEGSSTSGLT